MDRNNFAYEDKKRMSTSVKKMYECNKHRKFTEPKIP